MVTERSDFGHVMVAFEASGEVTQIVPGAGGVEVVGLGQGEGASRGCLVDLDRKSVV